MKVGIIFSPDPVYMNPFIKRLIQENGDQITCVVKTNGAILHKKNLKLKIDYFFSLLLIVGVWKFFSNLFKVVKFNLVGDSSIEKLCKEKNIKYIEVETVNSEETKKILKEEAPEIVFNQSQHIVKKDVLTIPKYGMFNRHGAPLPFYRGRLAPFWQILNNEKSGGLTFHFLNEKIDAGQIIIQKPLPIDKKDNFNSLVAKMFDNAVMLFPKALELIEKGEFPEQDESEKGSYFHSPRFKNALNFRLKLIKKSFRGK